jgi:hypothetical protein
MSRGVRLDWRRSLPLWVRLLLVLPICMIASGYRIALTPLGTQCPTAKVQQIKVAVYSPCGHRIGFVTRAPQSGEPGFLQCHCAEKRASGDSQALGIESIPFWLQEPEAATDALESPIGEPIRQDGPEPIQRTPEPRERPPLA